MKTLTAKQRKIFYLLAIVALTIVAAMSIFLIYKRQKKDTSTKEIDESVENESTTSPSKAAPEPKEKEKKRKRSKSQQQELDRNRVNTSSKQQEQYTSSGVKKPNH